MESDIPPKLLEHGAILRELVDLYCSSQRPSEFAKFEVHGPFTSLSAPKSDIAASPGCYAIYTMTGALKYIGMAGRIGYRSIAHFRNSIKRYPFWQKGSPASYIDLIPVYEIWEPHSLEAYLTIKTEKIRNPALW